MASTPKLRILHVGEWHGLSTGYSVYSNEVNRRLAASGKYEVAELACYHDGRESPPVPWRVYPNMPSDPRLLEGYLSEPANQFGQFSFNEVCLDFRPDVVWSIRDWWMDEFIERSPFRRHFRHALMPTVDAEPQQEQWISTYIAADAVFCYSDWGVETLRRESGGLCKLLGSAPPGADTGTFKVLEKRGAREALGMEPDAVVVGTTMRNQARKLYPDLIAAFARFLDMASPELASRSRLYLHTSYPDRGWDIPRLIKRSGIAGKILVTYHCGNCKAASARRYQDVHVACERCGGRAEMPGTRNGVSRETLAVVFNSFDVYAQYANSEGFGLPQVEAAACGVPVFATDYSAMSDVVRKVGGYPIRVLHRSPDPETGCLRATPDPDDFARALVRHFGLPDPMRREKSRAARTGVLAHYTWDKAAEKWMAAFDGLPAAAPWDAPPRLHTPPAVPKGLATNEELVRWCLRHYLGRPELAHGYMAQRMIRDLNWGSTQVGASKAYQNESALLGDAPKFREFGARELMAEVRSMHAESDLWERRRCGLA